MTKRRVLLLAILIAILLVGVIVWFVLSRPPKPLLPKTVTDQATFVIYFPGADWSTPAPSASYKADVLTLKTVKGSQEVTIIQQATPDVFGDVPQYFSTLMTRLNEYSTVGSANGQVHLTKPKELNGEQQAVFNNNGTLLFAHPNEALTNNDWRRFFNGLQIIKP